MLTGIYRITMEVNAGGNAEHYATTGKPLGDVLSKNYPGITGYAMMTPRGGAVVEVNHELFKEEGWFAVNPGVLDVFTFDLVAGNKANCFSEPNSVLLSQQLANKYFGEIDVVGKIVSLGKVPYTVKGVFADWPQNSHLHVNALVYENSTSVAYEAQDWFDLENYNYILVDPATTVTALNTKLEQMKRDELAPVLEEAGFDVAFHAQPLSTIFFEPGLIDDVPKGNTTYVNGITVAGLLLLLIAGINYLNLMLTQSAQRIKEISLKKVLGITRLQLWLQNVGESLVMSLLVMIIAGIFVFSFNTTYHAYTGFDADRIGNGQLLSILFMVVVLLGLAGMRYPVTAASLSRSVTGKNTPGVRNFKKVLLGAQFMISAVIIMATITLYKQIQFMKSKDLGYQTKNIAMIALPGDETLKSKFIQFKEQLKKLAPVNAVSLVGGGALPGEENGKELFEINVGGIKTDKVYNFYRIDEDYFDLLGIEFSAGRNFDNRASDRTNAVIINEMLARSLGWTEPLGKIIQYGDEALEVIGVVKNFHNKSLHNVMEPIVFVFNEDFSAKLLVKSSGQNTALLKSTWASMFPDTPFEVDYFDSFLAAQYDQEQRLEVLFSFFAAVSLALSGIGLFAIFSLQISQRGKELSIRKILGATSMHLVKTTTLVYAKITVVAVAMAIPIAWYFMTNWLNEFSYKITMGPSIFMYATLTVMASACLALAYHVSRALRSNPADALKVE